MDSFALNLATSLVLTLFLELLLALALKIRGKSLWIVVLVNFLTNPAVVFCVLYFSIPFWGQLLMEAAVVLAEGGIYTLFNCKEGFSFPKPMIKSFYLNAFSYGVGLCASAAYSYFLRTH